MNSAVLIKPLGRSRCFAFWQEFSKVSILSFTQRMPANSAFPLFLVLCRNGQPERVQTTGRRLLGVFAPHQRGMSPCTHFPQRSLIPNALQIARAKAIKEEFVKKVQHQAAESRKMADVLADGVITGVGLIQRDNSTGAGSSKA